MKRILIIVCLFNVLVINVHSQTGEETLRRMHNTFYGKWYQTFSFVQQTELYRNDSLQKTATWHEYAKFPYELRIDMEEPTGINTTIYKKDSTYRFQNGQLLRSTPGTNPFIFLIGGLYMVPYDSAKAYLQFSGFDLSKGYTTTRNGRKTFVAGALQGDTTSKQIWVDAEHLYLVRFIEKSRGTLMDVHMSQQVKLGGGWTETWVEFYFDGKLRQLEKYSNMKANPVMDEKIFDPHSFVKINH